MLNHVRTLLLNLEAAESAHWEEFICPTFKAVDLPVPLKEIHRAIFGEETTRAEKNYRANQLMTLLHSFCESDVLMADPRVTYWPPRPTTAAPLGLIPTAQLLEAITPVVQTHKVALFDSALPVLSEIWENDKSQLRRLCAVLLAFVHRVETLR